MQGYTKRQIVGAEAARALYPMLGYPSMKDYKWIISSNQIKDCPVTVQDVVAANAIWGKNIAALKGKTTRKKPIPVAGNRLRVPKQLMDMHRDVYMTCDIFFVNGLTFFISLSRVLDFTAVNHLPTRKITDIFAAFKEIYSFYLHRGFKITDVHADGEFAPLQVQIHDKMPGGPRVNLASASEHVPEIERRIRVVKERVRAARLGLPFTRVPKTLMIHIVLSAVQMLTHFPTKESIAGYSPRMLLTGSSLDYKKNLRLALGSYCQVHEEDAPRNSQKPRT
jgi:hypothetical protein